MLTKGVQKGVMRSVYRPGSACLIAALLVGNLYGQAEGTQTEQRRQQPADDEIELKIPISSDPGKQPFVRQFLRDEWRMWTSPFRRSSYESRVFPKYVLPFTLITGALIATDHRTSNLLPNTEDQSKWSLRVSQIGAPYTLAGISAGMYLISRATGDKRARETGFLGAIAIAHSQIVTAGLKYATQRERPFQFKENNSGGVAFFKGGDSFPSGHSSGSFALATVFAYEYGSDHKWVPWVSYGVASTIAASRLSAEKHWVSDIFVGGTMGFLVGRWVYRSRHDPRLPGTPVGRTSRLFRPQIGFGAGGLSLTWDLNRPRNASAD
jgi:membrane-associated phospholipid phosphatase